LFWGQEAEGVVLLSHPVQQFGAQASDAVGAIGILDAVEEGGWDAMGEVGTVEGAGEEPRLLGSVFWRN